MQVEQTSTCLFVGYRSGKSAQNGNEYLRVNVVDDGQVLSLYCDPSLRDRVSRLSFGDDVQLVFRIEQWKSGLHCELSDFVAEKKM